MQMVEAVNNAQASAKWGVHFSAFQPQKANRSQFKKTIALCQQPHQLKTSSYYHAALSVSNEKQAMLSFQLQLDALLLQ